MTVLTADPTVRDALPPAAAVSLRGVWKSFSAKAGPVLSEIDLDIPAGQIVSIVGASGCGKSTLLGIVAGLDSPTVGSVSTPSGRPALMFQDSALLPWLTARRNVELALRLRGGGRRDRADEVARLLRLVHLGDHGDKRVHELSGGMRQRVALARALAQGADVLLMDEPFAALDAQSRRHMQSELLGIWAADRRTVVFVTHDIDEAVVLADRVLVMSGRPGHVLADIRVPLSRPRDRHRDYADARDLVAQIWDLLGD